MALRPIVSAAKSKVPDAVFGAPDNWSNNVNSSFPQYDAGVIRRGLTYSIGAKRSRSGFTSLATLFNRSAAGGIIETAGRVNPSGRRTSHEVTVNKRWGGRKVTVRTTKDSLSLNPNAGNMMIERLNQRVGDLQSYKMGDSKTRGRLLYAAYAENQGRALDSIMRAVEKANNELKNVMRKDRWTLAA